MMIKRFIGCGGGRLTVREESVWGEYCVGEGNREESREEERSDADTINVTFQIRKEKLRGKRS